VTNCIVSETFLNHVSMRLLAKLKGVRRASFLLAIFSALLVYGPPIAIVAGNGTPDSEFSGMVWERHGDWYLNGSSQVLRLGEAIPPGGLLTRLTFFYRMVSGCCASATTPRAARKASAFLR
jgi:hypothetical protein